MYRVGNFVCYFTLLILIPQRSSLCSWALLSHALHKCRAKSCSVLLEFLRIKDLLRCPLLNAVELAAVFGCPCITCKTATLVPNLKSYLWRWAMRRNHFNLPASWVNWLLPGREWNHNTFCPEKWANLAAEEEGWAQTPWCGLSNPPAHILTALGKVQEEEREAGRTSEETKLISAVCCQHFTPWSTAVPSTSPSCSPDML